MNSTLLLLNAIRTQKQRNLSRSQLQHDLDSPLSLPNPCSFLILDFITLQRIQYAQHFATSAQSRKDSQSESKLTLLAAWLTFLSMRVLFSRTLPSITKMYCNSKTSRPFSPSTMASTVDSVLEDRIPLSSIPYSGCDTRIVSLFELDIPEDATDEEYRSIYTHYTQQSSPQDKTSNASLLRDAIESIKYGISPPVAFPTETVYGLGADATNEPATSGIFAAKGRPSDNPLIVHVASISHLERVTGVPLPEIYKSVAEKFWPGPLTILLPVPSSGVFAKNVHPTQTTIGFRIPSSKYARFFIAATDRPPPSAASRRPARCRRTARPSSPALTSRTCR